MHSTTSLFRYLMALPSRTLTTRGLITYPDTATESLSSAEISSWRIVENAGANLPIGGVGSASLDLKLDNRSGEWLPGGSTLGRTNWTAQSYPLNWGYMTQNMRLHIRPLMAVHHRLPLAHMTAERREKCFLNTWTAATQ